MFSIRFEGLDAIPGAIFSQLTEQLNVDELGVSTLFSLRSIGYIASCIFTGISLDKFEDTHKFNAVIMIFGGVASSLIPYTNNMTIQYVLWIVAGFAFAHIEAILPVYIYRAYKTNPDKKLNVILVIYGLVKTFAPLIIQLSITAFGSYASGNVLISSTNILFSLCVFFLNTPKHDELRSIQKELERTGSLKSARDVVADMEANQPDKFKKYGLVGILSLIRFLFTALQSGLLIFITLYCTDHLDIDAQYGRYLISIYFGGQLLYRIAKILLVSVSEKAKQCIANSKYSLIVLLFGFITCCLVGIAWIVFPNDLTVLFAVFFIFGFFMSATFPALFELCESVMPVTGKITSFWSICGGSGDFFIISLMGKLIDVYGPHIQPYPITAGTAVQVVIVAMMAVLFCRYKAAQSKAIASETVKASE